jgi:hypothetical protein
MSAQQGRKGFSTTELFNLFDEIIDDVLADPWEEVTPKEAVGLSEIVAILNVERKATGRELVALPPWVHLQVNACAKKGMLKGKGRKGQPREALIDFLIETVLRVANENKYELKDSGAVETLLEAENQALKDAAKTLLEHGMKNKRGFAKPGIERLRKLLFDI